MNQLTSVAKGSTSANFWYDGFGRICTRQINGGTGVRFNVYDGWNLIEEYNYNTGDTLNARYLYGEGEMVSMNLGGESGATYYLYQDGRGNNSQIAGGQAIVQENYKYDLDGIPTVYDANGNVMPNGSSLGNRFFMGGQQYFSEIGLYNLRNRFYLPALGRFLQPDPIGFAGDPANIYRYCGNNPVNHSDPSGLNLFVATYDTVPGVLHIGIGLFNGSPSTSGTYGYDPSSDSFGTKFGAVFGLNVPSGVAPDSPDHRVDYVVLNTTPEQDSAVLDFIDFVQNNPALFDYNFYTNNCGCFFVYDALAVAGIYVRNTPIPRILLNRLKHLPNAQTSHRGGSGGGGGGERGGGSRTGGGINVSFGLPVFVGINNPTQSQLDNFIANNPGAQIGASIPGLGNGQPFVSSVAPGPIDGGTPTKPPSIKPE